MAVVRIPGGEAFMAGYRIRAGDFPDIAEPNTQHPVANTQHCVLSTQLPVPNTQHSAPNIQHCVPNTQHCVSNTQHVVPNTQHFVPNTQRVVPNNQHFVPSTQISKPNTRNPKPTLSTVWSKILKKMNVSESTWGSRNRCDLLIPSLIPPAHRCTCGVRAQWGQPPPL